ncbi:hypothetical protein [Pedobacter boryungensis]|uniref:SprT-like domain-containing protein n=1 Tax=Pedobacter boryungensis TaxID=869962 RepID=A0ABX2DBN5_9SPHI|nr:hypothetical protein [Pedobacter boryungensis]NQX31437.1 hypothetical protein [Pedobacter boryungensis]
MKKNYILEKRNSYALILFIFIALCTNSCKKEIYDVEKLDPARKKEMLAHMNGPKVETINFAQFKSKVNINALGTLKSSFITGPSSKSKLMAVNTEETYNGFAITTDSIKVIKANGHTSYVFPVKLSSKRAVSFQNLTIEESPTGTIAFVNTYTPSKKWIADWKAGHAGKFDGDIGVTYLNLNTGNLPSTLSNSKTNTQGKISSTKDHNAISLAQVCNTTTYYYAIPYSCGSGQHGPGDSRCALTGSDAAGYVYITSEITTCYDIPDGGGGGGGGTTPTPPGDYDPCSGNPPPPITYDNNAFRGGKLAKLPVSPCDEEPLPQDPPVTKEIINNITDPCLKTTISEALATNKDVKGFLSDLINKYAGLNNGIKINLSNGNISMPAQTNPSFESNGTFKADITFQNGYYNDVSKEAVIAALIHEVVHAYLYQTNSTYKNQTKAEQHNFLFTNFVQDIATYLTNKYNMPAQDAYGLAWSGMGDIYNNASDNDTFVTTPAVPATATTPAIPAKTMTKTELGSAVAPYKHTDTGSKGTPNCPK